MAYAFKDVNFIPEEVVRERKRAGDLRKANKVSIVVAVLTLVIWMGLFGYNWYKQNQILNVNSQIAQNEQRIEELKDLGVVGYQLGIRLEKAKEILNQRTYFSKLVREL